MFHSFFSLSTVPLRNVRVGKKKNVRVGMCAPHCGRVGIKEHQSQTKLQ